MDLEDAVRALLARGDLESDEPATLIALRAATEGLEALSATDRAVFNADVAPLIALWLREQSTP
jgi:hypothetical protein